MLKVKKGERLPMHEVIPTPSFGLNHALGGGLWTGRYHVFWGNPSAGKTTLALQTLAAAQGMGYEPWIIDSEGSITDAWQEKCGIDLTNREFRRGTILEEVLVDVMPEMRKEGAKRIFLFDSINTLVAEQFYKKDDSQGGMGMYARSQTFMMQKLANELICGTDNIVLLVAQQTVDMSGYQPMMAAKLASATKHWNSNEIKFFASKASKSIVRDKGSNVILDHEVLWTIMKSRQRAVIGAKGSFWYNPEDAVIDKKREVFEIAVRNGIIEPSGPYFRIGDEKYHGKDKAMAALTDGMVETIITELEGTELEFEIDESVALEV